MAKLLKLVEVVVASERWVVPAEVWVELDEKEGYERPPRV